MTLKEIRDLLVSIDPDIRHYFTAGSGRDYTYWEQTDRLALTADNRHEEAWRFYVHRFTRDEFDPLTRRIFETLDADPRTAVSQTDDYEPESGYIHHIFTVEAY